MARTWSSQQDAGQDVHARRGANAWLEAARSIPAPPAPAATAAEAAFEASGPGASRQRVVLVAAHGGAGATAWTQILGGTDGGGVDAWAASNATEEASVLLVLRASVDGIAAAKNALAVHGAGVFGAALVVAAGPGKAPRRITDELRILAGALPLVQAPWLPALLLKRAVDTSPTDLPAKELSKLTTTLTKLGISPEGDTK